MSLRQHAPCHGLCLGLLSRGPSTCRGQHVGTSPGCRGEVGDGSPICVLRWCMGVGMGCRQEGVAALGGSWMGFSFISFRRGKKQSRGMLFSVSPPCPHEQGLPGAKLLHPCSRDAGSCQEQAGKAQRGLHRGGWGLAAGPLCRRAGCPAVCIGSAGSGTRCPSLWVLLARIRGCLAPAPQGSMGTGLGG